MFKAPDEAHHIFNIRDFDRDIEGAFLKENIYCTFLNKDYRVLNILYLQLDRTIPIPPTSVLMIETFFKPKWDLGHKIILRDKEVRKWKPL
jgi:hypothetical protein